ncbi:hypothetical protein Pan153_52220 [Gimesia panareensis]|uniref:DUF72 domain-containing protein n=1 Tax=Gimesia panareensis TaxID=2527978 RepID=A0A518FWC8_9PLAN|nr:DUF72 domain-containing protein [Gimesia panareensis]QDV20546.1 hypothetical protein Pan153_52220 [Gimesia panareensis]
MAHQIRIGTSGWNYDHWKGRFYPDKLKQIQWFSHSCDVFNTVEINNTFYHQPENSTFYSWHQQAPNGFGQLSRRNFIRFQSEKTFLLQLHSGYQAVSCVLTWREIPYSLYPSRIFQTISTHPFSIPSNIQYREVSMV